MLSSLDEVDLAKLVYALVLANETDPRYRRSQDSGQDEREALLIGTNRCYSSPLNLADDAGALQYKTQKVILIMVPLIRLEDSWQYRG